jgi:hypothetical protein
MEFSIVIEVRPATMATPCLETDAAAIVMLMSAAATESAIQASNAIPKAWQHRPAMLIARFQCVAIELSIKRLVNSATMAIPSTTTAVPTAARWYCGDGD